MSHFLLNLVLHRRASTTKGPITVQHDYFVCRGRKTISSGTRRLKATSLQISNESVQINRRFGSSVIAPHFELPIEVISDSDRVGYGQAAAAVNIVGGQKVCR